ncbi:MAG: geranylgeranyl reductase family protein [Micrococcales bacterium]|nr:geranylgeranyl reductase family protein [Micrococcales bacterium]
MADAADGLWDVIVVGAGPAGSSAARVAAERGARVLLLDRARFPRYKTCGGGIIGTSLQWLPPAVRAEVTRDIRSVVFSLRGRWRIRVRAGRPFLGMVDRERFDQALVDAAVAAGAEFRDGTAVRGLEERDGGIRVRTDAEPLRARVVVGADGASGRCAAHVGVRVEETDLGLEDEIAVGPGARAGQVLLDWGRQPGSYAWLFPKGEIAAVGVIARRGNPDATRAYLARWTESLGLAQAPVLRSSGHLTRVRAAGSPVRRGAVLVAGDAAGLLEPWTREGISAALRSGCWAGAAAAEALDPARTETALAGYEQRVAEVFDPEREVGMRVLRVFERAPWVVHAVLRTRPAQRFFLRVCIGATTLARACRHRPARVAVGLAAGRSVRR